MTPNEVGMQLHNRATQGQTLSAEEQSQLESGYSDQDVQEDELLRHPSPEFDASQLQSQIDVALTQLTATTQRIQETTAENETIRREITTLQRQLSIAKSA